MRAKNMDQQYWNLLNPEAEFNKIEFDCDGSSELCTYFPVGLMPELDYEMYDIAVQVRIGEEGIGNASINFHVAYVDPSFTKY